MNKSNIPLLKYIRQNAQMGTLTLTKTISIIDDIYLRKILEDQLIEYQMIFDYAGGQISKLGDNPKEISKFVKYSATTMIDMQALTDKSSSHIAEMIIIGSTRGIVAIYQKLRDYKDADVEYINLTYRLLAIEQSNLEQLKRFL